LIDFLSLSLRLENPGIDPPQKKEIILFYRTFRLDLPPPSRGEPPPNPISGNASE
jgi:hypothetical protein